MSYWSKHRDGGRTPSDQHLLYTDLRKQIPDLDDIPSFSVVRNPIKRFISEWKWQRWEIKHFKDSLTGFIDRVEKSLAEDPVYWDNHWRPQTDFLSDRIDHVIRLEDITTEFPRLLESLELDSPPVLPRVNPSSGRGLLAWIRRPKASPLTQDDAKRLQRIYAEDFANLGYESSET